MLKSLAHPAETSSRTTVPQANASNSLMDTSPNAEVAAKLAPDELVDASTNRSSLDRRISTTEPSRYKKFWLTFAVASLTAVMHGVPWLTDSAPLCGLIAVVLTLILAAQVRLSLATWIVWGTVSIAMAFHWAPGSMAFTISSGYALGLAVAAPLILWDGIRLGLIYWTASRVTRDVRLIWLPAALTALIIEAFVPTVFPWRLGMILLPWPGMIQAVDLFGAGWISLALFAHAGLICIVIVTVTSRWNRPYLGHSRFASAGSIILCGAIVLFNGLYSVWSIQHWNARAAAAEKVSLALIQVDPSTTTSLGELQQWTRVVADQVDLVCWPESSGGNYEAGLDDLRDREHVFQRSREPERGLQPWPKPARELLLAGKNYVGDRESPSTLQVTAMLIDTNECIAARYHKRYLMPFGEYVPGEDWIPGMAALFDMAEHIQPGTEAQPLVSRTGARLGTMLCFEDMVSQASIDMTRRGANVLISLINGSAFESPYTLSQHRALSQLRAVECRKPFLRCAATGQTCMVFATGSITDSLPLQQSGALIVEAPLLAGQTVYTRMPWLGTCIAIVGWLTVMGSAYHRRANQT